MRVFATFCLLALCGCSISSRTAIRGVGGRNSYNEAIQNTNREQMLLNLVRLRYCDTPFFLDVATVTTQYTYGARAMPSFPIPGFNQTNPFVLGGELSWQNQPTIQYSPLEGTQFAIQLLQPLDLTVLQSMIHQGWDIDRVFKLTIQGMDELVNAPNASGPTPIRPPKYKKFFKAVELMRQFQIEGQLQVGVKVHSNGYEGSLDEGKTHKGVGLQVSFPDSGEDACELASMLEGLKDKRGRYYLSMDLGYDQESELGIMPRSILACMYYLSLGVEVPPEDFHSGRVIVTKNVEGDIFNWDQVVGDLMKVEWSSNCPEHAYIAIKYRDHWFYIDDRDTTSKRTFVLLMQLYNLQSGEVKSQPPLLTIPLGV